MKYFGAVTFGFLMVLAILGVLWLSHGAGTKDSHAMVLGLAVSPILYIVFSGPFFVLFVIFLIRSLKN